MSFQKAIHVYPQDDIEQHVLHCDYPQSLGAEPGIPRCHCPCNPTLEEAEEGAIIVRHHSFDGREGLEWFSDIMNNTKSFET